MIEIERADKWRHCNCCYSQNNVHEFYFQSDGHGTNVALCADCIEELRMKIPGREVKVNE